MILPADRLQHVLELLKERRSVSCSELCEYFQVSAGTVRKDLRMLEDLGHAKRTYGGAVLSIAAPDAPAVVAEREVQNAAVKDRIARRAAEMVRPGETVFIDGSTTSLFVARHLRQCPNLTVITNAERVVMELCECEQIRTICTGGALRRSNLSYVGENAERLIRDTFYADRMFFSCFGISRQFGVFDAVESESNVKKAMFGSAQEIVLLCDSSKFGKLGFPKLADLSQLDCLVSDFCPDEEWESVLKQHRVELVRVPEEA
ncbi:DeoR/GlpR family DNA-binding transcription regulator [Agathobaculum sp.]|uniref:DeoR/GlpR family DNA-binding transcription regulator n=1 Tax=Agathobaculum sp. TaxID=2048138 RepID=UPI002A7FB016|nr:DeoR/GlpR family DNA-binding transcription regulator [Agathobaculum sp.]MDY3618988.1 DeoR/GlpR family DNA-binding transcription regulator [Agathobaculum sp.]